MRLSLCDEGFAQTPGSVDPTFDPGLGVFGQKDDPLPVRVILPLPDGGFVIGGHFTNYNGVVRPNLAKGLENGAVDESFAPPTDIFTGLNSDVFTLALQPDGKIIVGGIFPKVCVRLNADGSLDQSFSFSRSVNGTIGLVASAYVRADGRIAVATDTCQAFFHPDGSIESFFSYVNYGFLPFARVRESADRGVFFTTISGMCRIGGAYGLPDDAEIYTGEAGCNDFDFQSDGKLVLAGRASSSGMARRFLPNGRADSSFVANIVGAAGGSDVYTLAVQTDDKIIIGGRFTKVSDVARRNLARLNPNGSLDESFLPADGPNGTVNTIAPSGNGKALIGGSFTMVDGLMRTGVARIFLDAPTAPQIVTQPTSAGVLQGGEVRLAVAVNGSKPFFFQWKRNGEVLPGATNSVLLLRSIQKDQAGAYIVEIQNSFGTTLSEAALVTVNPAPSETGDLDVSYARGEGSSGIIYARLQLPDGKSMVGGDFLGFDGKYRPLIARLTSKGLLDSSFNPVVRTDSFCTTLALQDDGKILAGLDTSRGRPTDSRRILMRFNADGSVDTISNYTATAINAILLQPDGKFFVGGRFPTLGQPRQRNLARLNYDGSVDASFDAYALNLPVVHALAQQSDGKLLVGATDHLYRINLDATIDADISVGISNSASHGIRTISIQPDGKILIGGHFFGISGVGRLNLARLNVDLTVDLGFNPDATGYPDFELFPNPGYPYVRCFVTQPDGKILVGGTFTNLAGITVPGIGRLFPNGALDKTFDPDLSLIMPRSYRVSVYTMDLDDSGTLTMGGFFSAANGIVRNSIARIFAMPARQTISATLVQPAAGENLSVRISFPTSPASTFTIEYSENLPAIWQELPNGPHTSGHIDTPVGLERYYRVRRGP